MQKHIFYYTISLVAVVSYYWYVWALYQEANDNHVGIICISGINIAGNMAKGLWRCMKG